MLRSDPPIRKIDCSQPGNPSSLERPTTLSTNEHIDLPIRKIDCSQPGNSPWWERLIDPTISTTERVNLLTAIFSDRDEANEFKSISGDDAQAFIDTIDEVSAHILPLLEGGLVDSC